MGGPLPCDKPMHIGSVMMHEEMIFTWSMAQGMRQRISFRVLKMCGNEVGKHGAACTAGKAILPMLSSCVIPIRLRMEFIVTDLHVQHIFDWRSCAWLQCNTVGILSYKYIALPLLALPGVSSMDPCLLCASQTILF